MHDNPNSTSCPERRIVHRAVELAGRIPVQFVAYELSLQGPDTLDSSSYTLANLHIVFDGHIQPRWYRPNTIVGVKHVREC